MGNEDVLFLYGSGCERADARLLYNDLCCVRLGCKRSLLDELVARGYDLTTFKFVIRKKP